VTRARSVAAAIVLLAVVVVPFLLLRRDDGKSASGGLVRAQLAFAGTPKVLRVPELPRDRVLTARLTNTSLRPAELDVDQVKVVDAQGRTVKSSVRFLSAFAHGLFSAERVNLYGKPGKTERRRLGEIATLKPRQTIPITLSWRIPAGGAEPVAVDFGGSRVALP
jgi:hypothetical protein